MAPAVLSRRLKGAVSPYGTADGLLQVCNGEMKGEAISLTCVEPANGCLTCSPQLLDLKNKDNEGEPGSNETEALLLSLKTAREQR